MTESIIEQATLAWLEGLGWMVKDRQEITPGEMAAVVKACPVRNSVDENGRHRYGDTRGNGA
jgi:hypothetical protein